jgi:hypothetical protein
MKNKALHITGSICRTLLALTFLFSGFVKAVDPLGTVYKIEDYLKAFGGFFTDLMPWAFSAAVCLIALEMMLGVCMLLNVRTSLTSWLTLLFYCVMTPLTLYIALNNPVSDCGCFGDALVLTNWQTFGKNVVLLVLAVVLVACRRSVPQTFVWQAELGFAGLALTMVAGLMVWTLLHLPMMDFRPYKVGNNIPALMEYPEDAEPDQYEITFVYARDGVEQTFTLEDYPKGDSSWVFVRQNSKLIKKGYEPPVHDFEILTLDYEDITFDILESVEPVTLIVMYDLRKSDRKQTGRVQSLLNTVHGRGRQCYILTGSGTDDIRAFAAELGMDELTMETVFCTCDPVTLKTVVRANPGVVVVKDGTIIDKYNLRNR